MKITLKKKRIKINMHTSAGETLEQGLKFVQS